MRITKAEVIAISITGAILLLVVGIFIGRSTVSNAVVVQAASPEPSELVETTDSVEISESEIPAVFSVEEPAREVSVQDESLLEVTSQQSDSGKLDINAATALELESLPGIGEVLAQRIVAYREENGSFTAVEELMNVEGIGDKKFEALENLVEVGKNNENTGS